MERIGESVEKELVRRRGPAGAALAEIVAAWPRAVGEEIARQAWPLRLGRDGTLHVATSSSTWAFELDRLRDELHGRLSAELGPSAPPKLRFRVGPVPEPATRPATASEPVPSGPEASPHADAEAASLAAEIDDPELRSLVERAARASLARSRSGRQI